MKRIFISDYKINMVLDYYTIEYNPIETIDHMIELIESAMTSDTLIQLNKPDFSSMFEGAVFDIENVEEFPEFKKDDIIYSIIEHQQELECCNKYEIYQIIIK